MMPGKNTLTVNSQVVIEALRMYLGTQFTTGELPDIESVEVKKEQYTEDWQLVVTLVAPAPKDPT